MDGKEMVSVPRELTPEMREAFHNSYEAYEDGRGECPDSQWRAMLRAAPKLVQHQGEPVAWLAKTLKGGLAGTLGLARSDQRLNPELYEGPFPVFRHADPGEVERLRTELAASREVGVSDQQTIQNLVSERDTLRAQLTEAHALLRHLYDNNELSLGDDQRILTALSASAEPSEPKCNHCHDQGEIHTGKMIDQGYWQPPEPDMEPCPHCANESSAPVERDERAEFEKSCHDRARRNGRTYEPHYFNRRWQSDDYVNPQTQAGWVSWQARAALERNH